MKLSCADVLQTTRCALVITQENSVDTLSISAYIQYTNCRHSPMTIKKHAMTAFSELHTLSDSPPTNRKQVLAETLRQRVLRMDLAPGAVIDESSLCEAFGLSRSPVRELLRQLATEGYIELAPNKSPRAAFMDQGAFLGFFQAAPLIYTASIQLAATQAAPAELHKLKAIQSGLNMATAQRDAERHLMLNNAFHLQIGHMAHNDYLLPSLRRLLIDHARLSSLADANPRAKDPHTDRRIACEQHESMISALERHDAETAGVLMREYFERCRHRLATLAVPGKRAATRAV